MEILYYVGETNTPMGQWQRTHFYDELSRHGVYITVFNPFSYNSIEEAHEAIVHYINLSRFDLFLTCYCSEQYIKKETIEYVKTIGIPTLSIRFDNLVIPYRDKKLAPLFDLLWLTAKETKHIYDRWGVDSFFAPYAANPYRYNYTEFNSYIKHICFIGTPYGSRAIMINSLTEQSVYTDVFFNSKTKSLADKVEKAIISKHGFDYFRAMVYWDRFKFREGRKVMYGSIKNKLFGQTNIVTNDYLSFLPPVKPEEQSPIYSKYVLSLASTSTNHTDILKNPLKIVNLRNFEIPMSGGIEICKYNPELAEYFEEGKEILFYRENEELIDKARYFLNKASSQEISTIKKAARKRAENEHTWWNRFSIAFEKLGLSCK